MPADKRTLLRDAQKLVQKGQLDKAIATYREIVQLDPKDANMHNTLGDLYLKRGKKKEAIAEYLEVANHYEKDGWGLRAIAMCQKILNLDADLVAVRQKLADLYAGQKLPAEARAQYLQVADHFDRKGDVASALGVFGKIANLDPENLAVRVKLAGMFERQKSPDKAAAEYVRAAKGYLQKKDPKTAILHFVRAFKLHPANFDARRALADYHYQRQEWQVLVGLLQPLAGKEPWDTELLVMYAEALTRVNHPREAAAVLARVREAEPNAVAVNLSLGRALLKAGKAEEGIAALNRVVGAHIGENRLDQAEELLREMAAAAPEDERIQQQILEVLLRRGDREGAAEVYFRLAGIREERGLLVEAAESLEKYLEIRPGDAAASERALELRTRPFAGEAPPAQEIAIPREEPPFEEAPVPQEALPPPEPPVVPAPPAAPPMWEAPADEEEIEIDFEGDETVESLLEEGSREDLSVDTDPAAMLAEAEAPAPAPPPPSVGGTGWHDEEIVIDLGETAAAEVPEPVPAPPVPSPAAPEASSIAVEEPPRAAAVAGEAAELLAEADFYFQQGLLAEAAASYRKLGALAPEHPIVDERLAAIAAAGGGAREAPEQEIEIPSAKAPSFTVAGETAAGGEYADFLSDLRQELETDLTPQPPAPPAGGEQGLDEIFQEFQRSVKEQLGEEDYDTHYNLGIAYKEMGLVEEAIGEFALAERSPARGLDALSMIALCLRETGRDDEAMERLTRGVERAAPGSNEQKGFLYDLAQLQERSGRGEEAQETFRRLAAVDAGYRDVAARVGAAARPAPAEPGGTRKRPKVSYL